MIKKYFPIVIAFILLASIANIANAKSNEEPVQSNPIVINDSSEIDPQLTMENQGQPIDSIPQLQKEDTIQTAIDIIRNSKKFDGILIQDNQDYYYLDPGDLLNYVLDENYKSDVKAIKLAKKLSIYKSTENFSATVKKENDQKNKNFIIKNDKTGVITLAGCRYNYLYWIYCGGSRCGNTTALTCG